MNITNYIATRLANILPMVKGWKREEGKSGFVLLKDGETDRGWAKAQVIYDGRNGQVSGNISFVEEESVYEGNVEQLRNQRVIDDAGFLRDQVENTQVPIVSLEEVEVEGEEEIQRIIVQYQLELDKYYR